MNASSGLPTCAVLICSNTADPRFYARDVNNRPVMICDGHDPKPAAAEVAAGPPEPSALDIAVRIIRDGYSATPREVVLLAHALIADQEELAELRDIADLVSDADITALPPELLAVKQRWLAESYAKELAEAEAQIAERWEPAQRDGVTIARCRHCGFEAFPWADATIQAHMKACTR